MDDPELVEAWRAGDRRAGDALISRHFGAVCRFFRTKLGDDVEDLIQATFADLLHIAQAGPITSVRAVLFTIARRRLLDHLRAAYQPTDLVSSISAVDLRTSPSKRVARDEEDRLLLAALGRISLDHRIALELAYWEDLSGPEIAQILDISERTVRSRLARAREALRLELGRSTRVEACSA